ncbi:hypothetical protein [Saccharopolyspora rosea]|uniref:hypothetical protein n=1 Tax=Saccharopolyspora rosea TaxID=524884 RepID=UPI0021D918A1|nr:hypothetical protein [Saccharopolyspora rosea]
MSADVRQLGRMTRGVIIALQAAVDDVERGHYDVEDRERLAGYLDNLAAALRSRRQAGRGLVVVEGERVDR